MNAWFLFSAAAAGSLPAPSEGGDAEYLNRYKSADAALFPDLPKYLRKTAGGIRGAVQTMMRAKAHSGAPDPERGGK